jgi:sRNA-binding carbon storage regulator CsrA
MKDQEFLWGSVYASVGGFVATIRNGEGLQIGQDILLIVEKDQTRMRVRVLAPAEVSLKRLNADAIDKLVADRARKEPRT